jgi:hypothetical protein
VAAATTQSLRGQSRDAARYALLSYWTAHRPADPDIGPSTSAAVIEAALNNNDATWDEINLAEQLLVDYLSEAEIVEGIDRRIVESRRRLVPDAEATAARYARMVSEGIVGIDVKRSFLKGLIADLQHFGLRSNQVRGLRANAIGFVSVLSCFAFALALVPFVAFLVHRNFAGTWADKLIVPTVSNFPNYGLYTAVSFGFLGALFSRFLQLQKNYLYVPLDDAETYYRLDSITLRLFVGVVAAVIVYFIAASGLVKGAIVPEVRLLAYQGMSATLPEPVPSEARTVIGLTTQGALVPTRDLALMVIWGFLAGFSEQLVPDLLSSTTTRISTGLVKDEKKS